MTQESKAEPETGGPRDQPSELGLANPPQNPESEHSRATHTELHEGIRAAIREEIQRQLAELDNAQKLSERVVHEYVERKLRDAFGVIPCVKSVAYTRKCDEWTLIITHDGQDKEDAHSDLIDKLSNISIDDPRMPVFEPWIMHVSEMSSSVPTGEKTVVVR